MDGTCVTPEARRYRPWILGAAVLTMAAIAISSSVLEKADMGPVARMAVAMAPIVMFTVLIGLAVLQVRHVDELHQRIQLEALAIAFPAAGLMGMGVEYLQKAGFALDWTIGDVWPWMLLVYVPAYLVSWLRYR